MINPTADSRRTVTGQTLGNCSSRSIREALRDNVPDSEFREIYDFITQNQVSQIISNLESEQKNLANILNIPLIKEQSISNTTYQNQFQKDIANSATNYFDTFFYNEGHTPSTKEKWFNKVAEESNLKYIKIDLVDFLSTVFPYKDTDLPITEDLFKPVINHIQTCFEDHEIAPSKKVLENYRLYKSNKEQIIKELSAKCLNDKNVNILIKAQIQTKIANRPA